MNIAEFINIYFHLLQGNLNLPMYLVEGINHCKIDFKDSFNNSYNGIVVEVSLSRPLLGNIITQFLPTTLFLIIRYQTLELVITNTCIAAFSQIIVLFNEEFFDMVIQVNLQTLLVLTTLYKFYYMQRIRI